MQVNNNYFLNNLAYTISTEKKGSNSIYAIKNEKQLSGERQTKESRKILINIEFVK